LFFNFKISVTRFFYRFSEFDPALHESARQEMKQGAPLTSQHAAGGAAANNKSYMKTGSLTIFSDIAKESAQKSSF
jgi:hypothetical protein